jgi:hypothetical protein
MNRPFRYVGGFPRASRLTEEGEDHAGEQIPRTVAVGIAALFAIILSLAFILLG